MDVESGCNKKKPQRKVEYKILLGTTSITKLRDLCGWGRNKTEDDYELVCRLSNGSYMLSRSTAEHGGDEIVTIEIKLSPAGSVDLNGNVVDYAVSGMPTILDLKHEDVEPLRRAMRMHEQMSMGSTILPLVLDRAKTPEDLLNSLPISVDAENFTMGSLVQSPVCAECERAKKRGK